MREKKKFDAAAISVADRSVTSPNEATKELNRRLEIVESLASAPLMFGMTGSELEDALSSDASHWLAATKKPESGKLEKPCLFTTASITLKAGFRHVDANGRLVSRLEKDAMPGRAAATSHRLAKFDSQIKNDPSGRLTLSADISSWSTNHKRRLVGYQHKKLAGCVGLDVNLWDRLIARTAYLARNAESGEMEEVIWPDGTYQGFTVFSDTNLHLSLWREVSRLLKSEQKLQSRIQALILTPPPTLQACFLICVPLELSPCPPFPSKIFAALSLLRSIPNFPP